MKKYIVPKLLYVELRAEENIATSGCTGSCDDAGAASLNAQYNTDYYIAFGS